MAEPWIQKDTKIVLTKEVGTQFLKDAEGQALEASDADGQFRAMVTNIHGDRQHVSLYENEVRPKR